MGARFWNLLGVGVGDHICATLLCFQELKFFIWEQSSTIQVQSSFLIGERACLGILAVKSEKLPAVRGAFSQLHCEHPAAGSSGRLGWSDARRDSPH